MGIVSKYNFLFYLPLHKTQSVYFSDDIIEKCENT